MTKNFDSLTNIACLNIRCHLFCANESKIFSWNQIQNLLSFKIFWQWIIIMLFNEFLFNNYIIENIKTFVMFNEIFVINNSFLKLLAQTTRRRKFFNINFLHSLISCLKFFNQELHEFLQFFIKIVRNVIDNFSRDNNLNVDQFKHEN